MWLAAEEYTYEQIHFCDTTALNLQVCGNAQKRILSISQRLNR